MDEAKPVHRRSDHWRSARAGGRDGGGGGMPQHGISQPLWWKAKFGGMGVSDAKRLKHLEEENAKLKKLLAEAMLDNAVLKDIASRKW
jgi:hypothetical protein